VINSIREQLRVEYSSSGACSSGLLCRFARAFAVAAIAFPLAAVPTERAGEPSAAERLHELLEIDFQVYLREFPHMATLFGLEGRHDALLELSPEALARRDRHARDMHERALAIASDQLRGQDRVSYELFVLAKRDAIDGQAFAERRSLEYMDQLNGPHLWMPGNKRFTPFRDERDYRDYFARLRSVSRVVDEAIALSRAGLAAGWANAKGSIERIPGQIDEQLAGAVEDDELASPLQNFPAELTQDTRDEIRRALYAALVESYRPALRRLRVFVVDELLPKAPATGGLAALPRGTAFYEYLIRTNIGPGLDADGIHALGEQEVRRIQSQLRALAAREGFNDLAAYFRFKLDDPRQYFESAEALLSAYRSLAADVDPKVATIFHQLPKAKVVVEPVSPAEARADLTARYEPPSIDGERSAAFLLNTISYARRPRFEMISLYLHEAVPGHHLQVARSMEIQGLPRWRRLLGENIAYAEGWALYAEKLGIELGLYATPNSEFGRLRDELWRAARLVVDTGIHAKGWTREKAVAYMMAEAALSRDDAEGEVDRYFVWPAQALGYKIGELKILELRSRAEQTLKSKFDLRDFHAVVIDHGSIPLPVLERLVDNWLARGGGRLEHE